MFIFRYKLVLKNSSLGSDKVNIAYNYKTNNITVTNENGKKTVYDYDEVGNIRYGDGSIVLALEI